MAYITFVVAAAITIFLSNKLAIYGDVIERKSKMSAVLIGLLIGGATSLPEITSSVTSIVLGKPNLALANAYGSNLFNLLILAVIDVIYVRKRIYNTMTMEQRLTGGLIVIMSLLSVVALFTKFPFTLISISIETLILITVYVLGLKFIEKYRVEEDKTEEPETRHGISLKSAGYRFGIVALFIMLFGSILTIAVDKIAILTGLGSSFAGTLLLAGATSLPEAISGFTAVKLNNIKLLIAGIYGSNLFNLLIVLGTDIIYFKGSVYTAAEFVHVITVGFGALLMLISLFSSSKWNLKNKFYMFPSILLIIMYFISTYLIFVYSR